MPNLFLDHSDSVPYPRITTEDGFQPDGKTEGSPIRVRGQAAKALRSQSLILTKVESHEPAEIPLSQTIFFSHFQNLI